MVLLTASTIQIAHLLSILHYSPTPQLPPPWRQLYFPYTEPPTGIPAAVITCTDIYASLTFHYPALQFHEKTHVAPNATYRFYCFLSLKFSVHLSLPPPSVPKLGWDQAPNLPPRVFPEVSWPQLPSNLPLTCLFPLTRPDWSQGPFLSHSSHFQQI